MAAENTEDVVYTKNIDVLKAILELLQERLPETAGGNEGGES